VPSSLDTANPVCCSSGLMRRTRLQMRVLGLLAVLLVVVVTVCVTIVWTNYQALLANAEGMLALSATNEARMIQSVARFDAVYSGDYPQGSEQATRHQIREAQGLAADHDHVGRTVVGYFGEKDSIHVISSGSTDPPGVEIREKDTAWGDAMRRALRGQSGVVRTSDFPGENVVAAYEPVPELGLGIVAYENLSDLRRSFFWPLLWSSGLGVFLFVIGGCVTLRLVLPMAEAQKRLDQKNRLLHQILTHAPHMIFWKDVKGHYQGCSRSFAQLLGMEDIGHFIHKTDEDLPWPRMLNEAFRAGEQQVMSTQEPLLNVEYTAKLPDGTRMALLGSKVPLQDEEGEIVGLLGIYADITEQKKAQQKLKSSNRHLKTILANSPFGVAIIDRNQVVRWANRTALKMANFDSVRDIVGLKCNECLCPPHATNCPVLNGNERIERRECLLRQAGDEKVSVLKTVEPILLDGEEVLLETFIDNSDAKRYQEELVRTQQKASDEALKLRSMIEGMEEGVVLADANDIVTDVNRWFLDKVGVQADCIVGKSLWEIHAVNPRTEAIRESIDQYRRGVSHTPYVVQRELLGMHLSLRVQPIFEEMTYKGVILNAIDVTDFVNAKTSAEAATVMKSQFLANMSHEIRTPMTAILGFTDMILDEATTPMTIDAAHVVKRNGEHLLQLINDILDISRVESGKFELDLVPWSPSQIVAEVISLMHVNAEAKGLALTEEHVGRLPETITTDPKRLRQILVNLVGNAIKFTDTGGVRIVTQLVDRDAREPQLRFDVEDTGIGIPQDDLDRIFEPFKQVDGSMRRRFEGTGLGLAISQQLTEALGGEIKCSSQPGIGSTFTFTIATGPLDNVRWLAETSPHTYPQPSNPQFGCDAVRLSDCHVLLAEDITDNQRLIRSVLASAGANVTVVNNGQQVVERLLPAERPYVKTSNSQESFDVILMDIQMPKMDGCEATRRLRSAGYQGPIVALTANAMRGDRERYLGIGCDDYLVKPIDRDALINTVAKFASLSLQKQHPDCCADVEFNRPGSRVVDFIRPLSSDADDDNVSESNNKASFS
jgi:PAS domain S-box-containing protein